MMAQGEMGGRIGKSLQYYSDGEDYGEAWTFMEIRKNVKNGNTTLIYTIDSFDTPYMEFMLTGGQYAEKFTNSNGIEGADQVEAAFNILRHQAIKWIEEYKRENKPLTNNPT